MERCIVCNCVLSVYNETELCCPCRERATRLIIHGKMDEYRGKGEGQDGFLARVLKDYIDAKKRKKVETEPDEGRPTADPERTD